MEARTVAVLVSIPYHYTSQLYKLQNNNHAVPLAVQGSQMQRLAVYFDVGISPWQSDTDWIELSREGWDKLFQPGISKEASEAEGGPQTYVLPPVGGQLKYLRRGPNVRKGEEEPIQEADVNLESVNLQITRMRPHPPACP